MTINVMFFVCFSSVEVLTQVMCDSELADVFKTQQVRLAHGLPLGSFLLKPVQRILKYHLMLQVGGASTSA